MDDKINDLDDDDEMNEFSQMEIRPNILSLMRNMMEGEKKKDFHVEIFDDSRHDIFPTFWGKEGQIATCRKCGKTGETVTKKVCGLGNSCCSCCFCVLCMICYLPCVCFAVQDIHHFCMYCSSPAGVKTFL